MKTSSLIWGGLIATAIFIEWNPKARKKIRKITGLSDKENRITVDFYNEINKDLMKLSPKNKVKIIQKKLAWIST